MNSWKFLCDFLANIEVKSTSITLHFEARVAEMFNVENVKRGNFDFQSPHRGFSSSPPTPGSPLPRAEAWP